MSTGSLLGGTSILYNPALAATTASAAALPLSPTDPASEIKRIAYECLAHFLANEPHFASLHDAGPHAAGADVVAAEIRRGLSTIIGLAEKVGCAGCSGLQRQVNGGDEAAAEGSKARPRARRGKARAGQSSGPLSPSADGVANRGSARGGGKGSKAGGAAGAGKDAGPLFWEAHALNGTKRAAPPSTLNGHAARRPRTSDESAGGYSNPTFYPSSATSSHHAATAGAGLDDDGPPRAYYFNGSSYPLTLPADLHVPPRAEWSPFSRGVYDEIRDALRPAAAPTADDVEALGSRWKGGNHSLEELTAAMLALRDVYEATWVAGERGDTLKAIQAALGRRRHALMTRRRRMAKDAAKNDPGDSPEQEE